MNIEDKLIWKVKKWVKETNIVDVDESDFYNPLGWKDGYSVHKKQEKELRDGIKKMVYVVSFRSTDYVERNDKGEVISCLEGSYFSAFFDAETLEPIYIIGKTSYIEPDGTIIRL